MTHQPNNVSAAGVLLPCPFCGATPDLPDALGTQYEIECDCGMARSSVQISDSMTLEERQSGWDSLTLKFDAQYVERAKEEAIAAWNRRAAASDQATAPVGWFVQRSSFGPWIEVERYEDGAVRLHRMDGDQATGPAVGESDGDKRAAHCVNTCNFYNKNQACECPAPWEALFDRVALELNCLPSADVSGNDHVFAAIRKLREKPQASALTDSDVFTLIGHADYLRGIGQTDMPAWCMELAGRIAEVIGDKSLADRARALAAPSPAAREAGDGVTLTDGQREAIQLALSFLSDKAVTDARVRAVSVISNFLREAGSR